MALENIENYRIVDTLGEGGIAIVYLAVQSEPIQRQVALKMIKPGMHSDQVIRRFESERQALAILEHPNIANVFDAGVTDSGLPYFAMELVRGESITEYCDNNRLSIRDRLKLFVDVCAAVQHAHLKGLIHRDIKPSNVLVSEQDDKVLVKVIDFGIAKAVSPDNAEIDDLTRLGAVVGTPQFMSPEQLDGRDIDTRVDVYALGVLLYELLVGVAPIDMRGVNLHALGYLITEKQAPRPSARLRTLLGTSEDQSAARRMRGQTLIRELSGDLDWIVMRAIDKDRDRRYETPRALADDVGRYLGHEPVSARPPNRMYLLRQFVRRNRIAVVAGFIAISGLLFGAVAATVGFLQAREAERVALQEAETARQVSGFLIDIFEVSDPSEARGTTLTAREVLESGASRIDKTLVDQPTIRASLLTTLAKVHMNLGLYADARGHAAKALALLRDEQPGSSALADALDLLGSLQVMLGEIDTSAALHAEALELRQALGLGPSVGLANTLMNLATIEYFRSNYSRAESLFVEALSAAETVEQPSADQIAQISGNLGIVYSEQGDEHRAEQYKRKALQSFRDAHGDIHPMTATMNNNLALTIKNQGRFAEAATYYDDALRGYQALYDGAHPNIANTMNNLAQVEMELGELANATTLQENSLAMFRKLLGDEHSQVATAKLNLGRIYLQAGRVDDAERMQRAALELQEINNGADHVRVGIARTALALTLVQQQKFEEARVLAVSGFEIAAKRRGADHWRTSRAGSVLGIVELHLGRFAAAESLLVPSYDVVAANLGHNSVATRDLANNIVLLYERWGKPERAEEFRHKFAANDATG